MLNNVYIIVINKTNTNIYKFYKTRLIVFLNLKVDRFLTIY